MNNLSGLPDIASQIQACSSAATAGINALKTVASSKWWVFGIIIVAVIIGAILLVRKSS